MAYYLDINLLPTADVNNNFLLNKLYAKLHLLLVQYKTAAGNSKVGFAFPYYKLCELNDNGRITKPSTLGTKLRLFAVEQQAIEQLNLQANLQKYGLLDYLHVTGVRTCPKYVKLQQFTRYRYKNANSIAELTRLARRYAKRHNISQEQALAKYANLLTKKVDLPYANLISNSNNNRKYVMHIKCTEIEANNTQPVFNTFGLAIQGGVPVFN